MVLGVSPVSSGLACQHFFVVLDLLISLCHPLPQILGVSLLVRDIMCQRLLFRTWRFPSPVLLGVSPVVRNEPFLKRAGRHICVGS